MRRIFIGDIHGCIEELDELIAAVRPDAGDRVISVGDLVAKGPASAAVLERFRDRGWELDTGCVYGGYLTAAILDQRAWRFERVAAHRRWAAQKKNGQSVPA